MRPRQGCGVRRSVLTERRTGDTIALCLVVDTGRTQRKRFVVAASALGIEARVGATADEGDVIVAVPNWPTIDFEVKSASLVSAAGIEHQLRRLSSPGRVDAAGVIVADRITAEARERLARGGSRRRGAQACRAGLFWELAGHWKPESRDLASLPIPGPARDNAALHLGLDDVESTAGWALTDTVAAAVYGAPVGMRADHPRDFYVLDQSTMRRAVQVLGPAATPSSRAGRVRLAPVSSVCTRRVDATAWVNEHWPLANPLFVALDLAQDPGRGREILDGWTPRKPWHRVW